MRVALLSGGTGGARLAAGMAAMLPAGDLSVIANTADDEEFWGLLVSPDVDAILYRLSGLFNEASGFGVRDDTFNALAMLGKLGEPTWFQLGDRDIGLHLLRAQLLRDGRRLTDAVAHIARHLGITAAVLPMSDDPVRTRVITDEGELSMQEWFVGRRCAPRVRELRLAGIELRTRGAGSREGGDERGCGDHRTVQPAAQRRSDPRAARRRDGSRARRRGLSDRRRSCAQRADRGDAPSDG